MNAATVVAAHQRHDAAGNGTPTGAAIDAAVAT